MYLFEKNRLPDYFEGSFILKRQVHKYYTRGNNEFYLETPRTNLRKFSYACSL